MRCPTCGSEECCGLNCAVLLRARVLVTKDGQPFECQVTSADGTKHSVWPKLEDVVQPDAPAWEGSERKRTFRDNQNWEPWTKDNGTPLICAICGDQIPQAEHGWHTGPGDTVYHECCSYQQQIKELKAQLAATQPVREDKALPFDMRSMTDAERKNLSAFYKKVYKPAVQDKALRELVAKWRRYIKETDDLDGRDYPEANFEQHKEDLKQCADELESLLPRESGAPNE
jgi:hypothetical protein